MTEDDLQAIEARANAATPGPWEARTFGPCNCGQCPAQVNVFAGPHQWPKINPPDAAFIASARTDVPELIPPGSWHQAHAWRTTRAAKLWAASHSLS